MKLHLDDVVYLMQAEGKKADYAEGVVYSVKVMDFLGVRMNLVFPQATARIR